MSLPFKNLIPSHLTEPAAAGCSCHWSSWVEPAAPGFYQCRRGMWGGYGCSCFVVPETGLPVSWRDPAACGSDGASSSAESAWRSMGWEKQAGAKVLEWFVSFLALKTLVLVTFVTLFSIWYDFWLVYFAGFKTAACTVLQSKFPEWLNIIFIILCLLMLNVIFDFPVCTTKPKKLFCW